MSIFQSLRHYRGIVGETLTPQIVTEIGRHTIGSEAAAQGQQKVVVARDGRLSGPLLIQALISGLQRAGRTVVDIGMVPTPLLYFATHHLQTGSGVMLTGSHNPSNYNGLKIMIGGDTLSGNGIQALKSRIETGNLLNSPTNQLENLDIRQIYLQRVLQDVKPARSFKIVADCGNGVGGVIAPELLRALGCEVIPLFCEVDGNFPNHHPDPSKPANLQTLIETVQAQHADFGLAFDGDADRLGVVDARGKIVWADRQMILYATDILQRHPGAEIIFDVKCSRHLAQAIETKGGKATMWCTGHSLIKAKLKATGALLAGEMSGHIFFKERWYGFDDALYTAARLLEILAKDPRPPTEVFSSLPDAVNTPELNLNVANDGEHFTLMQKILQTFQFDTSTKISTIDGLRVDFERGWGLVRPSNTTPCLVIRFEAEDQAELERIQTLFRQQFLAIDSTLNLPF
ncbi:MAG: phosphomannomutase/phosphoglucomutase [Thiotrichaceae bacterium]